MWKLPSSPLKRAVKKVARMPDGVRVYAIGDVHGRADLLDQVFARIDEHRTANPTVSAVEVFLGDYVDRGPASREVLDRLIERRRTHNAVCLMGNHELFVTKFLEDATILDDWGKFGGLETLMSYGLSPRINARGPEQARLAAAFEQALPAAHRDFLNGLAWSFTCGDFFFVHAGVRPGIPLRTQRAEDLLWIRSDFLLYEASFGKMIVHGHTPVGEPEVRANRINIDTGAYATGRLTCLVLEDDKIAFLS